MSSLLEYSISVIILLMLGGFLSILDLTNTILSSCNSSVLFFVNGFTEMFNQYNNLAKIHSLSLC